MNKLAHLVHLILVILIALVSSLAVALTAHAATVTGQVSDEDGRPFPGARVEAAPPAVGYEQGLRWVDGERLPEPVASGTTDAQGTYRLEVPPDRLLQIRVSARGHVPMVRGPEPFVGDEQVPLVRLPPAQTLDVTVEDETGKPLSGARVWFAGTAESEGLRRPWARNGWEPLRVPEITDGTGRARLPRLAEEELRVRAWAPGRTASPIATGGAAPLRFRLSPGASRPIEVRDTGGTPVAGALVKVDRHGWSAAVTDGDGRARVTPSPEGPGEHPGAPWVHASTTDGRSVSTALPPPDPEAPDTPAVVVLQDPWRVRGRVLSAETGRPIAGAVVWSREPTFTVTDDRGAFTLAFSDEQDDVSLLAAAPGHFVARARPSRAAASRRPPETVEITLDPAARLHGRVVDEDGAPLAGAEVAWSLAGSRGFRPEPVPGGRSDADGGFVLGPLDATRDHIVRATLAGYAPTETRVPAARLGEPVELTLETGTTVVGRVVGPNGEPVVGAHLRLHEVDPRQPVLARARLLSRQTPRAEATTAEDGRFAALHVAPGDYLAEIEARGYAPRVVPEFEVGDVRRHDLNDLRLEEGLVLRGQVVDEDGSPVSDATVYLGRIDPTESVVTGAGGSFRFEDLAPGPAPPVTAKKPGYAPAKVENIRLSADEPTPPLELVLLSGARLFGEVVDSEGDPMPGARVQLQPPAVGTGRYQVSPYLLAAETDGSFDWDDLPAGRFEVRVGRSRGPARQPPLAEVELIAGEAVGPLRLVAPAAVTVEGRVLDPDGRPASGARVTFAPEHADGRSSRPLGSDRTDGAGRFRLEGLPAGAFRVTADHPELGRADQATELRPGVNPLELRLRASGRIDLHVSDAETGELLEGAGVRWLLREDTEQQGRSTTDAEGRAVVRPSREGTIGLTVSAEGFRQAEPADRWVGDRTAERVEVRLDRGIRIRGRVLGLDPAELSRVLLLAFSDSGGGAPGRTTTLDRDGAFLLQGLAPGTWQVVAGSASTERRTSTQVVLEEGQSEAYVELEFVDGYALTVTVRADGEAVSGASIRLASVDGGTHGFGFADHRGVYRFPDLPAGRYRLTVSRDMVAGEPHEIDLVTDDEVVIELSEGAVRGRAVDAEGNPIANAEVALLDPDNPYALVVQSFSPHVTGADGRFELTGLPAGEYHVRLRGPNGDSAIRPVRIVPPVTDLGDVVLEATGEVALRFSAGTALPLNAVTVWARDGSGTLVSRESYPVRNGESRIGGLPDSARELLLEPGPYAPVRVVRSPGASEVYPVDLVPAATLNVRVPELASDDEPGRVRLTGPTGAPPVALEILLLNPTLREGVPIQSGIGTLPRLDPGTWTVTVTTSDERAWTRTVGLPPGETVEVVLE